MKQNKLIAITGGIGSGKSTVCSILTQKGYICLNCDDINRELLRTNTYLMGLKSIFPEAFQNNVFRKERLRFLIFNNEEKRRELNAYAHNHIMSRLLEKIDACRAKIVFIEIPLFGELPEDFQSIFTLVWYVYSDNILRKQRITERDNVSDDFAEKQIDVQNQISDVFSIPVVVINNNGNLSELEKKIEEQLQSLNNSSNE